MGRNAKRPHNKKKRISAGKIGKTLMSTVEELPVAFPTV